MITASIKLSDITDYHEEIKGLASKTSSIMYLLGPNECTELLVKNLLILHPLHLVKTELGYLLIAGIRTFEMAKLLLKEDQVVNCCLHDLAALSQPELFNLALADIAGSLRLFNCAKNPEKQTKQLFENIGHDKVKTLFKKLTSKQKIDVRN
ncbi:hypothetical protein [Paraglaciecola sp.]|uniref:hypothetical protein n=1 Tax=Paraglaciecola sp. TaxID=1920173 RepID=UPI00273FD436|nr:hypothetical protein [Paraglaciecola sp.]MDP5031793.1 hypothetical protein [Paraglaciecola sp.]